MSRDDVMAIRAYLNSLEPVRNARNANTLPFPFNIRSAMSVWNALYFTPGEFKPDPSKSTEWNRGKFIVDGPAHCGACHTPKTLLGGDHADQYLEGANLQGWSAPDITNSRRTGLGNWSIDDVALYLKTGHNGTSAATGPMAEAVELSTSRMTDADVKAIATYLKSLPGKTAGTPASVDANEGKGVPQLFPAVAQSTMVRSDDPTTVIRLVLRGARSVGTSAEPTAPGMPSYGWQLDDGQVAAVLNYIRNSWGGAAPPIEANEVTRVRSSTATRSD
jgi:mono/diheme cytochrome c family protein